MKKAIFILLILIIGLVLFGCTKTSENTTNYNTQQPAFKEDLNYSLNFFITKDNYLVGEQIDNLKLVFSTNKPIDSLILYKFTENSSKNVKYSLTHVSLGEKNQPKSFESHFLVYTFPSNGGFSGGQSIETAGDYTLYASVYDCKTIQDELGKTCDSITNFESKYGSKLELLQNLIEDTKEITIK